MDRMATIEWDGHRYDLNYSVEVMFQVTERFGGVDRMLEAIEGETKESFEALRWMFVTLANDGELARRAMGYDQGTFLTEDAINTRMSPYRLLELKNAVMQAIRLGYSREFELEAEEIDLGLRELDEKKRRQKPPLPLQPSRGDDFRTAAG